MNWLCGCCEEAEGNRDSAVCRRGLREISGEEERMGPKILGGALDGEKAGDTGAAEGERVEVREASNAWGEVGEVGRWRRKCSCRFSPESKEGTR